MGYFRSNDAGLLHYVIYFDKRRGKWQSGYCTFGISQPGGAMEGKEVRFGPAASAYWGICTTVTSNGSVNAMHDSMHADVGYGTNV